MGSGSRVAFLGLVRQFLLNERVVRHAHQSFSLFLEVL